MVGEAVLTTFVLGEAATWLWQRTGRQPPWQALHAEALEHLATIALLSMAAILINPYSIGYLRALPESWAIGRDFVTEWLPLMALI